MLALAMRAVLPMLTWEEQHEWLHENGITTQSILMIPSDFPPYG